MSATLSLRDVSAQAAKLPAAPWLLPKLMALLGDAEAAAEQVETVIRTDAGLASGTLRLANSAYFAQSAPCDTLAEAIVRLGFGEIYRLASTNIAGGWLQNPVEGYGWEPGDLYRHSLTVAVAADLLARETETVGPEIAYTGGLLHDVGKLALAHACAAAFEDVRRKQEESGKPWRAVEHEVLGFDHTDVAGALLTTWRFPENLLEAVRYYPRPALAHEAHRPLVVHIHAAKHLALCLGTGVGEDGFHSELDEAALREQGITPEMTEALLPAVLEKATRLMAEGG